MARMSGRKALINCETRMARAEPKFNMARPPGYQVESPLVNSGTRMAHKDLCINMARISGTKAIRSQRDKN